jgi:CheY-like chemotaxis protein
LKEPLSESGFSYRVLILDDEAPLRQLGKAILETQGYEVLCAADGIEGLAALKRSPPDIIVSDLQMPNMNGFEFLAIVRKRLPAIPVIVISGEFSTRSVPDSVLADAFFPKGNYKPTELFEQIAELLIALPNRAINRNTRQASIWVFKRDQTVLITCSFCLRTFTTISVAIGKNQANCPSCSGVATFDLFESSVTENDKGKSPRKPTNGKRRSSVETAYA